MQVVIYKHDRNYSLMTLEEWNQLSLKYNLSAYWSVVKMSLAQYDALTDTQFIISTQRYLADLFAEAISEY